MRLTIDDDDAAPAYEQVVRQVTEAISDGELVAGARLPTVRRLAEDLGLAVNTVARAYKQLEAEGHVATRGRNGTIVLGRPDGEGDEVQAAAAVLVRVARRHGLDLAETTGVLRRAW